MVELDPPVSTLKRDENITGIKSALVPNLVKEIV